MTTEERIYLALSTDAVLNALYDAGGRPMVFKDQGPQNAAGSVPEELAYTVYREMPAGQIYSLGATSTPGLDVRRYAFETWAKGSILLGLAPSTQAGQIAARIVTLLKVIQEPTGIEAVYPESALTQYDDADRAALCAQTVTIHTKLT